MTQQAAPATVRGGVRRARIRAPELTGRGGWVNTGGWRLSLADLRGRFVLLDFWTFCCVNCLHVIDELRPLEEEFADVLVVVGVHSPKFVHEADHDAVVAAVERHDVRHPVLDDPDLATWSAYTARAWPTLTLIDPEGYVVAQMTGEGHAHALRSTLTELVAEHEAKGTLRRGSTGGPRAYVPAPVADTELRFPGKVTALDDGTLLVSDTHHHSLVVLAGDGETVLRRVGSGQRGLVDGPGEQARFAEPQGLALLPPDVRERVGYDVVVADTVNHALRGWDSRTGEVRTVAGSGRQWMPGSGTADLSSPWDVVWDPRTSRVLVAMAGIHQLWSFDLVHGTIEDVGGTREEGLRDGPLRHAWFAQPSGLAVDAGTGVVWVADAETSALRRLVPDGPSYRVETVVGAGLFDFGHRDGPAGEALMQHPLGVTVLPDGSVAVSDTYNGAVRRYEPVGDQVSTLATGLAEPSAAVVVPAVGATEELLVVESAAHRLTRVPLPGAGREQHVAGAASRTRRPPTVLAPGPVRLEVVFEPPPGQRLDQRYGPATRLRVSATPPALLAAGAGPGTGLSRQLVLDAGVGEGVLQLSATAASCDLAGESPACHVHQQDWGVPVRLGSGAPARLALVLSGLDPAG